MANASSREILRQRATESTIFFSTIDSHFLVSSFSLSLFYANWFQSCADSAIPPSSLYLMPTKSSNRFMLRYVFWAVPISPISEYGSV